jgi:RHS repeat-associated protein
VRTDASGTVQYLGDALGSGVALTTPGGTAATTYTYEPFGRTEATGSPSANAFQYTGRENDGTGLYYYRARYYDPVRSRFVGEDPIGLRGGPNLFAYVDNSPTMFVDPLGLDRYNHCKNLGPISGWICRRAVDYSCSGPRNTFCCDQERLECLNNVDPCSPNAERDTNKCLANWFQCVAGTKGLPK